METLHYSGTIRGPSYYGQELSAEQFATLRRRSSDYIMQFYPRPVLRKQTKRARLRWQGKMRTWEAIRRLYQPE